jgi:HD superfamily phosphohydrolase
MLSCQATFTNEKNGSVVTIKPEVDSNAKKYTDLLDSIGEVYRNERIGIYWQKEKAFVETALTAISKHLPLRRYTPVAVLGVGGTSIVLRLRDSLFPSVDNALKFPRPIEGQAAIFAEMIGKELEFLADLRHPGIVRMLYYRTIADVEPYGSLPFYLMEVVEGELSTNFFSNASATVPQFLSVLRKQAETIQYLHTFPKAPYVHLDIKPQNIVITNSGLPVLLDLGTCKRLDGAQTKTVLAVTNEIAHPDLILLLSNTEDDQRAPTKILRSTIDPAWDLWAFGRTLLIWLGVNYKTGAVVQGAFVEKFPPYTRKYLFLLVARLLSSEIPTWLVRKVGLDSSLISSMAITTATQLVAQIGKLLDTDNPLNSIPELAFSSTGSIQAAPGVHVANSARMAKTLEHRLFRRLNAITQLGIVSQIFPSAKHTRREHSLGTYGNVCRMVTALYHDSLSPLFKHLIEAQDIREIMLTALLHDLGQFPLAHDLEDIAPRIFDHEALTQSMLKGTWRTGKSGSRKIDFESLSAIFDAWETTPDRIISILSARAKSSSASLKDKLLRSIISGPIDADKLDYLFRDARYTDVPYPNGIDVDRLYRCLTTIILPNISGGTTNVPLIGVHAKGKVAAEFMTVARYAMFSQVYWHHAVRAQKAMLSRAVSALLAHTPAAKIEAFRATFTDMVCALPESMYKHDGGPEQLTLDTRLENTEVNNIGVGTDLSPTDAAVLTWLRDRLDAANLQEASLLQGILTRSLFKRLWVVSRASVVHKDWDELCKLWDGLTPKQRDHAALAFERKIFDRLNGGIVVDVTTLAGRDAISVAGALTGSRTPWLLIDLPGSKSGSDVGLNYVTESQARRMRKDDRAMGDIQRSSAWEMYARDIRDVAGNVRVFCDERLIESVDASITQKIGFEELFAVVQAEASNSR